MKKRLLVIFLPFILPTFFVVFFLLLFSPKSTPASTATIDEPQNSVATQVWNYILKNGGTKQGAAMLLGNFQVESGLMPSAIQSGASFDESKAMNSSVKGYAFGLPQWDSGRRVNLLNYAKSKDKQWTDVNLQLDFMFNQEGSDSDLLKKLIKETDVTQATADFMKEWERAGNTSSLTQRQTDATYWYNVMTSSGKGSVPLATIPVGWTIERPINLATYTTESYAYRQCTWWVYNRAKEFGINYGLYMGNGADWQHQAGYTVTTMPTVHSAVSFSGGQSVGGQWNADPTYGHVAFVEAIHADGSVLISQSGTGFSTVYTYQVLTAAQASQYHYVIGK